MCLRGRVYEEFCEGDFYNCEQTSHVCSNKQQHNVEFKRRDLAYAGHNTKPTGREAPRYVKAAYAHKQHKLVMSAYKRLYKQLSALTDRLVGFGAAWLLIQRLGHYKDVLIGHLAAISCCSLAICLGSPGQQSYTK